MSVQNGTKIYKIEEIFDKLEHNLQSFEKLIHLTWSELPHTASIVPSKNR